jgi:hypothetical protein
MFKVQGKISGPQSRSEPWEQFELFNDVELLNL